MNDPASHGYRRSETAEPYGFCGQHAETCSVCHDRVTTISIASRCAASADTSESGMDVAALVCQRSPLSDIDEGTVFTGELDTPYP